MKILFLTTHLNRGGISRYILSAGRVLRTKGHELFVGSGGGEMEREFSEAGFHVTTFPIRTKSELHPKIYAALPEMARFVRKEKIDLIHAHTRVTQIAAFWIRLLAGTPYVTTAHGFYEPRIGRRLFPAWGERAIAISEPVGEDLALTHGVPREKIRVVYNGVDMAEIRSLVSKRDSREVRREYGIPEGALVVGIIARLIAEKGHANLIRAVKSLEEVLPRLALLIAGEGRERRRLESLIHELGLNGRVRFTGNLKEVSKPLSATDLFVLPATWREGFGLSVVEAMACGIPVVVTKTWALASLVQDRVNGILVDPESPAEIAAAIRTVAEDPALRQRMGEAGQRTAVERFSIERMARELESVYEEVVKA